MTTKRSTPFEQIHWEKERAIKAFKQLQDRDPLDRVADIADLKLWEVSYKQRVFGYVIMNRKSPDKIHNPHFRDFGPDGPKNEWKDISTEV